MARIEKSNHPYKGRQKRNSIPEKNKKEKNKLKEKCRKERSKSLTKKLPEKTSSPLGNIIHNRFTSKIRQVMSGDLIVSPANTDSVKTKTDTDVKSYIINVIRRQNTKELKRQRAPAHETQTEDQKKRSRSNPSSILKRTLRRHVWHWAKDAIKKNEQWSQLAADNNIMLDNINIDKFDISLIDLDVLGIESKILKRSIKWLFK